MVYSFDEMNNRRNTNSLKWDVPENELPMWVADMDFQTAPAVIHALKKRVELGIFGYQIVPDEWYQAIGNWWSERHNWNIQKEWLIFCTGVVPAITSAVKRVTNVGDRVLVQTPVYDIFFHSIENTGRHVLENPLLYDGTEYQIDFKDLEEKLSDPLTTMMILCNPHNPVGKIWSKEELAQIGMLCEKYGVTVLSDEIHCDIVEPSYSYIPYASVSECCARHSIVCISATKAFNIAGLQTAAVVIQEEVLRNKINRGLNSDEIAEPGTFAIDAVIAALTEGKEWLDHLLAYIYENKKMVATYIQEEIPQLQVVASHATYLLWIDCSKVIGNVEELHQFLREHASLYLSSGIPYRGNGACFLRMNIACPRTQVQDGLERLKEGVLAYEQMVIERC